MKLKTIFYATTVAAIFAACSNNDENGNAEFKALQVEANISGSTRVADGAFVNGDEIGLFVVSTAVNGKTSGDNVLYVADDSNTKFTSKTPVSYKDNNAVNVTAYYPYTESLTDNSLTVKIADQKDYLFASLNDVKFNTPTIELTFDHKLTQLIVNVKAGTGIDNLTDLTSVTLKSISSEATFNAKTGELTAKSTTADYALTLEAVEDGSKTSTQLLLPASGKLEIPVEAVYDGVTYKSTLAAANGMAAGKSYTYTLTLNRTGLVVEKATINPWVDDTTLGNDANSSAEIPAEN
jgi:hypothetical protein